MFKWKNYKTSYVPEKFTKFFTKILPYYLFEAFVYYISQSWLIVSFLRIEHMMGIKYCKVSVGICQYRCTCGTAPAELTVASHRAASCPVNHSAHSETIAVAAELRPYHRFSLSVAELICAE